MKSTTLQLSPSQDYETIRRYWIELTSQCEHNYFQSWGWIETWLKSLNDVTTLSCYIIVEQMGDIEKPVLGFFIGYKNYYLFKFLPVKAAYLNEIGNPIHDQLTIEDNDILATETAVSSFTKQLQKNPLSRRSEFHFHWASEKLRNRLQSLYPKRLVQETTWSNYYVNLQEIRNKETDYLSLLSSNKRQQIRRSIREYEKVGELTLEHAQDSESAINMLRELAKFHQAAWNDRQHQGAFANQYFMNFHQQLISNRFSAGEILLTKVSAGGNAIGYIYGFIYANEFLYYQSGFKYESNNKLRPGLVSHYLLVQYFLQKEIHRYDFMAGEDSYKKSLSTDKKPMYIIRLRHKQIRYYLFHFFIACWQVFKTVRKKK